jgi:hypothetical protein
VEDDGKLNEAEAARVLTDLIKKVQEKMKGFSRKKTLEYYREIMRKAWDQVGTQDYSQAFEWLLLDREMPQRARERFPTSPMPVPDWWAPIAIGRTFPSSGGGGGGAPSLGAPVPSGAGPVGAAHSIVTSLESFSHNLVSSVPGLATKVTQGTNPVPVSSGGGGRSGGGGCACACACAGCACACAGGGR